MSVICPRSSENESINNLKSATTIVVVIKVMLVLPAKSKIESTFARDGSESQLLLSYLRLQFIMAQFVFESQHESKEIQH